MARIRKRIRQNTVKIKPRNSRNIADRSIPPRLKATLMNAALSGMRDTKVPLGLPSFGVIVCKKRILPKRIRIRPKVRGRKAGPGAFKLPKGKVADQIEIASPRTIQKIAVIASLFFIPVISLP